VGASVLRVNTLASFFGGLGFVGRLIYK